MAKTAIFDILHLPFTDSEVHPAGLKPFHRPVGEVTPQSILRLYKPPLFMPAQRPDRINLKGIWTDLYSNPLESYRPAYTKKRPAFISRPDCERGYVAHWIIKHNQLYLSDIDGFYASRFLFFPSRPARYTVDKLFPKAKYKLVPAVWFSGKLRIPQGTMRVCGTQGYDARFDKEIIVEIEKGHVLKMVVLDLVERSLVVESNVKMQVAEQPKAARMMLATNKSRLRRSA